MATNRIDPELSRNREREAMLLRLKGKSHTEIAKALGVSRQAVGRILRRAEKLDVAEWKDELAAVQLRHLNTLEGVADRLVWNINRGCDSPGDLHLLVECLRDIRLILSGQMPGWKAGVLQDLAFPEESSRLDKIQIPAAPPGVTFGPIFRKIRELEEEAFGFHDSKPGTKPPRTCVVKSRCRPLPRATRSKRASEAPADDQAGAIAP
jgi:hypothetical protein